MTSRLVRAERVVDGDMSFIVAGELGAVELRLYPNYCCFYVHSPVWRPDVAERTVQARGRGRRGDLPGMVQHRCHLLEGDCWTGLTPCGDYDFDRPDVDDVPQWEALEGLYLRELGDGSLWGFWRAASAS